MGTMTSRLISLSPSIAYKCSCRYLNDKLLLSTLAKTSDEQNAYLEAFETNFWRFDKSKCSINSDILVHKSNTIFVFITFFTFFGHDRFFYDTTSSNDFEGKFSNTNSEILNDDK